MPPFLIQPLAGAIAALAPQADERVVQVDAVRPLVEFMVNSQDGTVLGNACRAVATLAKPQGSALCLLNEGVIKALVRLLVGELGMDELVQFNAIDAMRNMAVQDGVKAQMVVEGAVLPLVALCYRKPAEEVAEDGDSNQPADGNGRAVNEMVTRLAKEAVAHLALDAVSGPRMVLEGAVRPLIVLCEECGATGAPSVGGGMGMNNSTPGDGMSRLETENMLEIATQALANLALHEASRPQMVTQGVLRPLVLLSASMSPMSSVGVHSRAKLT